MKVLRSERKLGREVLELTKRILPAVYNERIRGRLFRFVEERTPSDDSEGEEFKGEEVGRLGGDLRLLWSMAIFFDQMYYESVVLKKGTMVSSDSFSKIVMSEAYRCIALACRSMFWRVSRKFVDKNLYCLSPQWDILFSTEMSSELSAQTEDNEATMFIALVQRQMLLILFAQAISRGEPILLSL